MCGIAGFCGIGNQATITGMVTRLRHRGPDDNGIYVSLPVYLGHTRLAILDIAHGKQPFVDEKTGLVLVYNGEIYNHQELRAQLISLGHIFITSHSDTETVLRSFIEWGPECFVKFNGMFALAIYDPRKRSLYFSRDRFGEKPLFYIQNTKGFAFASEIGALASWDGFDASLDMDNVQRFFAWGYLPGTRTIHPNCHSLGAGYWMRFDIDTGAIEKYPYWQFHIRPDYSLTVKQEVPLVEELRALLIQAVKRRLLSDVPLGLFLSGGIDSGTVLAAAASILPPENIRAFTIGFTEPTFDESSKARTMADAFGIEHNVSMLTLEEMQNNAHDILRQMSEPLGDASLIPTYTLAAFARKQVIVSLSGDGGDELFAGYDPFLALGPASLYNRMIPRGFHRLLRKAVNILPPGDANMSLDFKIKRMLRGLSYNNSYRLPVWMSPLEPSEIRELFTDPLSEEELYEDAVSIWETNDTLNDIDKALLFFTRFYLPNDILVKVDRATTMVSMESRAVFLDNDLVDFCTRLPDHFKLRGTNRKYLLKKALHGWIPGEILNQSKKGFGIPLNRWLRGMECPQIPANIRQEKISAKWDAHRQRKGDHRLFLWSAIALQNIQTLA